MSSASGKNSNKSKENNNIISACQAELNQLKLQVDKLKFEMDKDSLFDGATNIDLDEEESIDGTLRKTTGNIDSAQRVGEDTIRVGAGIMRNLKDQGDKMKKGREEVQGIQRNVGTANSLLTGLWFKMLGNKVIKYIIIFVLIIAIVAILYVKFFYNPNATPVPSPSKNVTVV